VPTNDWNSNQDGTSDTTNAPIKGDWTNAGIARHTFTHFHLELNVWYISDINEVPLEGWWCQSEQLSDEALPTLMRKVIKLGIRK